MAELTHGYHTRSATEKRRHERAAAASAASEVEHLNLGRVRAAVVRFANQVANGVLEPVNRAGFEGPGLALGLPAGQHLVEEVPELLLGLGQHDQTSLCGAAGERHLVVVHMLAPCTRPRYDDGQLAGGMRKQ